MPDAITIQLADADALQVHPTAVATLMLPEPPDAGNEAVSGDAANVHDPPSGGRIVPDCDTMNA